MRHQNTCNDGLGKQFATDNQVINWGGQQSTAASNPVDQRVFLLTLGWLIADAN